MVTGNRKIKKQARELSAERNIPYTAALSNIKASSEIIEIKTVDKIKLQLSISPLEFPYQSEGCPVYAQIELPDGTQILAFDYGLEREHTLKDNVTVKSWVHPAYIKNKGEREISADHLITESEFSLLLETEVWATAYDEDEMLEKFSGEVLKKMTSGQLFELVKKELQVS